MGLPENAPISLYNRFPKGKRNLISDVPGVSVGHCTLRSGEINTGVTAILPHPGDLFHEKVLAGVSVINGFGKSTGLVQIRELGTLETPILMTNTLSVGTCMTALVKYMLQRNEDICVSTGSVNCVVTECNDSGLNDIRGLHVREEHVFEALEHCSADFEEGAVGAGTGMRCLGFKGGIGSASRVLDADGMPFTVGALVLANFGAAGRLMVGGDPLGRRIQQQLAAEAAAASAPAPEPESSGETEKDRGSIIIVLATDVPLNERQLTRMASRSTHALGRVGSYSGNGSGDIAVAFSTAERSPHYSEKDILSFRSFFDNEIDKVFEATVEATEEAIISALYHAETTTGVRGNVSRSLREFL